MTGEKIPDWIEGIKDSFYAGFGVRLSSMLLDFLIVAPVYFFTLYLNGLNVNAYYFTFIPGLIFNFWYFVYLVKRYGGTPGKLLAGIKIIKLDGTDVYWKEAILRHIVTLFFTVLYVIITLIALSKINSDYYESLNWRHKANYLKTLAPVLFIVYRWASDIWSYSELLVLLFNRRKRALHDFMAGTVVVKIQYLKRIHEAMNFNQEK